MEPGWEASGLVLTLGRDKRRFRPDLRGAWGKVPGGMGFQLSRSERVPHILECSSTAEQEAVNFKVAGSNPAIPAR